MPPADTLCQKTHQKIIRAGIISPDRTLGMDASVHRRVTVALCWALARRAALDGLERFEDNYALTEEFREWLVSLDSHPEMVSDNVLMVPCHLFSRRPETDGLLEI